MPTWLDDRNSVFRFDSQTPIKMLRDQTKSSCRACTACRNFAWHMQDSCKMRWIRRLFLACHCPPSQHFVHWMSSYIKPSAWARQLRGGLGRRPTMSATCPKGPLCLTWKVTKDTAMNIATARLPRVRPRPPSQGQVICSTLLYDT